MKKLAILIAVCLTTFTYAQDVNQGKKAFEYERYNTAKSVFQAAIKADPSNAEAWEMLVRTYIAEGKINIANDTLKMAPPSLQSEPYFKIATAAVQLNMGDSNAARQNFFDALQQTKNKDVDVMTAIAEINIESPAGDNNFAISTLQQAVKRDKKNATLYADMGRAYRNLHNGNEAYRSLQEAIDKDKNNAIAYYELGQLFKSQKNSELYLDFFKKSVNADPAFGPGFYELYYHYLYVDPAQANEYFRQYASNSDQSLQQAYSYTDLLYLNKNYDSAILMANNLIKTEGDKVQDRLYKLIAYSLMEKTDTMQAIGYMQQYFQNAEDSNKIAKDYETMGQLYASVDGREDSTIYYWEKAAELSTDTKQKVDYYQRLATLAKKINDYNTEAHWLGKYYLESPQANNVALFNWGLAAYRAMDYLQADSVFGLYATKYPEQGFGYYWRARANAGIDTSLEKGLAIPYYEQVIKMLDKDSLTNTEKAWLKESYAYLARYEANTQQDYPEAIAYFEKILELEPDNATVQKNIEILEKNLAIRKKNEGGSQ